MIAKYTYSELLSFSYTLFEVFRLLFRMLTIGSTNSSFLYLKGTVKRRHDPRGFWP